MKIVDNVLVSDMGDKHLLEMSGQLLIPVLGESHANIQNHNVNNGYWFSTIK